MALNPFTVSQVNEFIQRMFKTEPLLRPVVVKGEISYLNFHSNGSIYLTIKDTNSKLECVIFPNRINDVARSLEVGEEVILAGNVEAFPAQSKYSLWVNAVEKVGAGELAAKFEKLKKKLNDEGLFDPAHKKQLPAFPKHIGVITSKTGAAVKDILKILTDRTPLTDVTVFPAMVQGPLAAQSMIEMLDVIEEEFSDEIDLVIIGRGGGSAEDLAVFNDEELARAIYDFSIPIISAVGHEIDISISDFVADVRAETPTAAAQMAVKSTYELRESLDNLIYSLNQQIGNRIMSMEFQLRNQMDSIVQGVERIIDQGEYEAEKAILILKENNPMTILNKGYALVSDENGKPILSSKKIKNNKIYNLTFADGIAKVKGEEQ